MASVVAGQRILVVEDEPLVAEDMAEALAGMGAKVHVAGTLKAGLDAVKLSRFAAAVVDYRLGEYDCTPLCERLIEERIPFVICSGRHRFEGAALEGVYLAKPADPAKLVLVVQNLLEPSPALDIERIRAKYS